jgi:hypothetical protein
MRKTCLSFIAALVLLGTGAKAQARVGQPFHLSRVRCNAVHCSVGEGYQPGLSTLELSGSLPDYAGYSVRLVVGRRSENGVKIVADTLLGIFSDGHFTASIPAYNYADGAYAFAIVPKQSRTVLASGTFVKRGNAQNRVAVQVQSSNALTGDWIGIAGTFGRVHIYPDGRYTFNELAGRYTSSGNTIVFSGPLAVWNNGHATIGNGTIEFYWTTAEGAKQYFVFEKS